MLLLRITQKQHKLKITESKYPMSTQWVLDVVLIGSRFWHTILHLSMGTPQDYGMVHVEHDNFLQKNDLSRRQLEERILFMFMLEMISLSWVVPPVKQPGSKNAVVTAWSLL